jgi:alcohol dehydrogenase class IV
MGAIQESATRLCGEWRFPTEVRFGAGRVAELGALCRELGIARPLIVTDRGLGVSPIADRVRQAAASVGVAPRLFAGVHENPSDLDVDVGLAAFHEAQADGVIALGGGSGLDCGKAIALLAGCGGSLWRFAWPNHRQAQQERGAVPIIAVATTAGTGAEVEASAMITESRVPAKRAILHRSLLPKIALADPELTFSLPAHLTAATGMDALSHSLEALCVADYHPMADAIALDAIASIGRWLPVAVAEPKNLEARSHMMAAAIMGATAFVKGLGAMHALSHAIGALQGCHHGLTNAVLMPFVLEHNRARIEQPMARLAATLALPGEPFPAVHRWVLDLRRRVGIPDSLAGLGTRSADFAAIAALAASDGCAGTNPVALDVPSLREILEAAA